MPKACSVVLLLSLLFGSVSVLAGGPKESDFSFDFQVMSASIVPGESCNMELLYGNTLYEVAALGPFHCRVFSVGDTLRGRFKDSRTITVLWNDGNNKVHTSSYRILQEIMVPGK